MDVADRTLSKAVVLHSGGLDSSTVLAIAANDGYEVYTLSFRYGQRHDVEVEAAARIAAGVGVKQHVVVDLDTRPFAGSALTDEIEVPKGRDASELAEVIPVTYVPARNTVFLSYALAWAESLGTGHIFIGVTAVDYSGYPDCRPEYIESFERMANLATKAAIEGSCPVKIHAPLLDLSKAAIIARGIELGVDYGLTRSCYDPAADGAACGACDACLLRLDGFAANEIADPAPYQSGARVGV